MKLLIILTVVCQLVSLASLSQVASRNDIIMDELMADPSPPVGLPNAEWVELRNCSSTPYNLLGWRIGDATGQSGAMPAYVLKPDSFVIVCSSGSLPVLSVFGPAIAVTSFPTLNNTNDVVFLRSPQNKVIHCVSYSESWYGNELKREGGWSLEMIDTRNPCSGSSNWRASNDVKGGTPGKKNSVDGPNPDKWPPRLLRAYSTDSTTICLVFDEPLDSGSAALPHQYGISDGIGVPLSAWVTPPSFDRVYLKTGIPLQRGKIYSVSANGVADCAGNNSGNRSVEVGISEMADSFDLVINEILFNPKNNGVDYVEIYNRSKKVLDLKNIFIANRNPAGSVSNIAQLSTESRLFFPAEFRVVTSSASLVQRDYFAPDPDAFIESASMPAFNDDKGNAVILNEQGRIVDELAYSENWHFKGIDNREGVALERIDYNAPTQLPGNWHSAATSVGYGTPTYKNSQSATGDPLPGELTLTPAVISPDNDGRDDYATIGYEFPSPGYVINITVFDAGGRVVRYLQRNALCGTKGVYHWDGLGESSQKLPMGIYIILSEAYNLEGKKKWFKNVIVLARRN